MPNISTDIDKAFIPFHKNQAGQIVPAFHSRICVKSILGICREWKMKIVYPDLEYLYLNDWGACKRPRPLKL